MCILQATKEEDIEKTGSLSSPYCVKFWVVNTIFQLKLYEKLENDKKQSCTFATVPCDIMIIPQASLAGKAKQKSIQFVKKRNF